jgi:hypothetical protein
MDVIHTLNVLRPVVLGRMGKPEAAVTNHKNSQ